MTETWAQVCHRAAHMLPDELSEDDRRHLRASLVYIRAALERRTATRTHMDIAADAEAAKYETV